MVTIAAEGRDKGKTFHITEMSALQAERWATRVLFAMAKGGAEIPEGIADAGMAGLIYIGLNACLKMNYEDAEPLLNEMLTCVKIIPDPAKPLIMRSDIEGDIEEVATLITLRSEIFYLHTGFSLPAILSK